jgi:hypothetical protein
MSEEKRKPWWMDEDPDLPPGEEMAMQQPGDDPRFYQEGTGRETRDREDLEAGEEQ